jgi:hypothetical protein
MKKLLALGLVLLPVAPMTASASQWWILSGQDNQCHQASQVLPMTPTPFALHQQLRAGGLVDDIQETNGPDGKVAMVVIHFTDNDQSTSLLWFPDKDTCELAQLAMPRPDLNALK